jgi:hypothetical protein
MKRIKKNNESMSSKGLRRNQSGKKQRGSTKMTCIISLENGSAIWLFPNSEIGSGAWYLPKQFLDDQKSIRNAIEKALCQLANFESRSSCKNEYPI